MKTTLLETFLGTLPDDSDWIYHPPVLLTDYAAQFNLKSKIYDLLKEYDKQKVFIQDGLPPVALEAALHKLSTKFWETTLTAEETVKDDVVLCCSCENDDILLVVSAIMTTKGIWVEVAFIITKDAETLYEQLKTAIA